jgi:hypothetical protein
MYLLFILENIRFLTRIIFPIKKTFYDFYNKLIKNQNNMYMFYVLMKAKKKYKCDKIIFKFI